MSMGLGEISSGIVVLFMFILGVLLTKHYLANRRIYMFWWAIAFWLAFLAAITDFISYLAHGWSPFQYRLYLFSAASLVAYMGAGTVFLFSERVGRIYVLLMTVVAMAMCYSLAIIPVEGISTIPAGEKAQGFVPNGIGVYFGILSGIGAIALFVGALYSWYRSKKSYNLWIAMGALVFSIGGVVGKYIGVYQLFYVFQAVGSVILYYGIISSISKRSTLRS